MHALLLAATLTFGTVQEPAGSFEIDREVVLAPASAPVNLKDYRKESFGAIDVYSKSTEGDEDHPRSFKLDVFLATGGKVFHFETSGDGDPNPEEPHVTLLAPGIVSLTHTETYPRGESTTTTFIDLRGKPRAVSVTASRGGGGESVMCGDYYSVESALTCNWSTTRDDFDCREARVLESTGWSSNRVSWRRWTLFGGKAIASSTDLRDPRELLARKRTVVRERGATERVPLTASRDLFLIPPTGNRFTFRGWLVDYEKGKVFAIETRVFRDDAAALYIEPEGQTVRGDGFTPDREPMTMRVLPPIDRNLTPIVITDGTARAFLWLGYDGTKAALLRIATDAKEFNYCEVFRHPASASSVSGTTLQVEAGWFESEELPEGPSAVQGCSFSARVHWDHGFVVKQGPPVCRKSVPVAIHISDDGKLTTTPSTGSVPKE